MNLITGYWAEALGRVCLYLFQLSITQVVLNIFPLSELYMTISVLEKHGGIFV